MIDWIKEKVEDVWFNLGMIAMILGYLILVAVIMGIVFGVPAMVFVWVVESISNLFK